MKNILYTTNRETAKLCMYQEGKTYTVEQHEHGFLLPKILIETECEEKAYKVYSDQLLYLLECEFIRLQAESYSR